MEETIDLRETYRELRAYNKQLMIHCRDDSLTDDQFFKCGIYLDIVENTLSIVVNRLRNNLESIGVDNNCRSIMEAVAILKMDEEGHIKDSGKKLYRYLSPSVDYDNIRKYNKTEMQEKLEDVLPEESSKLYEAACEHFNCTKQEIKKSRILRDPYCYLAEKLDDRMNILFILSKYDIDIDDQTYLYTFFSTMIHPRCEINQGAEQEILHLRSSFIDVVLNRALNVIEGHMERPDTSEFMTLDEIFEKHPEYDTITLSVDHICDNVIALVGENAGYFVPFYFAKIKYLFRDMFWCLSIGIRSMTTTKAKSFLEMHAALIYFAGIRDEKERHYRELGLVFGSRIQINNYFEHVGAGTFAPQMFNGLKLIYDGFYRDNYNVSTQELFVDNLSKNLMYVFDSKPKSHISFVKDILSKCTAPEYFNKIMTLYTFSLDMEHASGHNFTQNPIYTSYYAFDSLHIFADLVWHFLEILEKSSLGVKLDFSKEYDFLDKLSKYLISGKDEINTELEKYSQT